MNGRKARMVRRMLEAGRAELMRECWTALLGRPLGERLWLAWRLVIRR